MKVVTQVAWVDAACTLPTGSGAWIDALWHEVQAGIVRSGICQRSPERHILGHAILLRIFGKKKACGGLGLGACAEMWGPGNGSCVILCDLL